MTRSPVHRHKYVHALDGIRFFAVFMVLLKHVGLGASSTFVPLRVLGTMAKVGTGVPLFFVVSGYLITRILFETQATPHRYRNFIMRRSLRIFPLYFGYLAVAQVLTLMLHGRPIRFGWVYGFYLQNTFTHLAAQAVSFLPLYHLWTLGVQEQFYLLWPFAIWACREVKQVKRLCWGVVLASFVIRLTVLHFCDLTLAEQFMPSRAGEMAFGGLFAMETYERSWLSAVGHRLLAVFAVLCTGMILLRFDENPFGTILLHECIALFATALLASALNPATVPARLLGFRPLAEIGRKYSYGLFIFHPMVIVACNHLLHLRPGYALDGTVRVLLTVVVSVLLAKLSYTCFEEHCLRLKRWFPADREAPIPVSIPVPQETEVVPALPAFLVKPAV